MEESKKKEQKVERMGFRAHSREEQGRPGKGNHEASIGAKKSLALGRGLVKGKNGQRTECDLPKTNKADAKNTQRPLQSG